MTHKFSVPLMQLLAKQDPVSGPRSAPAHGLIESRLPDIRELRDKAANSPSSDERMLAMFNIVDMDSFAYILDNSPHEDVRAIAKDGLDARLRSFGSDTVRYLSENSRSRSLRSAASELLTRQG